MDIEDNELDADIILGMLVTMLTMDIVPVILNELESWDDLTNENDEVLEVRLGCTVGFTQSDTSTSVQYIEFCFRIARLVSIFIRDVSTEIETKSIITITTAKIMK